MKNILFALHFCNMIALDVMAQSLWEDAKGPEGVNIVSLQYSPQGILYGTDYGFPIKTTFRSTDEGLHWEAITGPNNTASIINLNIGLDGTIFSRGSNYIDIYYSIDKGEIWSLLPTPNNSYGGITSAADGAFLLALNNTIVRTYDKTTWDTLFSYVPGLQWPWTLDEINLTYLDWLKDGRLVASTSSNFLPSSFDVSFLISSDNGISWDTFLNPSLSPRGLTMMPNGQFVEVNDQGQICISNLGEAPTCSFPPFNPLPPPYLSQTGNFLVTPMGRIIVSNWKESLSSDDGGQTWQPHPAGIRGSLLHEVLPSGYIFSGSFWNGNTRRSANLGQTWSFVGYGSDHAWSFDWVFKSNEKVFAVSNGIWRSLDGGAQWELILRDSLNLDENYYNLALSSDGILYTLSDLHLLKTSDDGNTFEDISPDTSLGKFYRLAVQPQTGNIYLTGGKGLIRSFDQGLHWTVLDTTVRFSSQPIAFHPNGDLYGTSNFVGQVGSRLIRSSDGGLSWQVVTVSPSPSYNFFDIVRIMPDGKIITAGSSGYATSHDNGVSWQRRNIPLSLGTLAINALGHAFIGDINSKEIYKTENDGQTWTLLSEIPSNLYTRIINLAIAPDQNLWVCSDGDGHFKTATPTVSASYPTAPTTFIEIFPNPTSGAFWAKWPGESSNTPTTLILRDLTGKEVFRQNLQINPGYIICPEQIPGFYMVEIRAGVQIIGFGKVILK